MTDPEPRIPGFSAEQAAVIRAAEPAVWVTAAAGSGKTRCLVRRLREHIEANPGSAAETVAFTFTRKAAQEMLGRLRLDMARHGSREAVRAVDRLNIGTIDSFCNSLLRENAVEAGLDPQFEVLDPAEARLLGLRTARQVVEAAAAKPGMAEWFRRYEAEELVTVLVKAGERLRSAGDADAMLAAWQQGPGRDYESFSSHFEAGKVRLQHQELQRVRDSAEAVIRLLESGAREEDRRKAPLLRAALAKLESDQWHLGAWGEAREFMKTSQLGKDLRAAVDEARGVFWERTGPSAGWMKAVLAASEDPNGDRKLYGHLCALVEALGDWLRQQAEAKQRMIPRGLDFQDVLLEVLRLESGSEAFRARIAESLRWVMVDELQDVNGLQSQLLEALGRGGKLFGVGDPMQSIYRFRHADVALFMRRLRSGESGAGATPAARKYELLRNYRSVPGILAFVNAVFPRMLEGAPAFFSPVEAARGRAEGPPPVELVVIERRDGAGDLAALDVRLAEARVVARRLRALMDSGVEIPEASPGTSPATLPDGTTAVVAAAAGPGAGEARTRRLEWKDIAILFRSGRPIATFVKALEEEGIPSETLRPASLFESVEAHDLLALLRVMRNPRHDVAMATVLRSPFVDLSDSALVAIARRAAPRRSSGGDPAAWIDVLRDAELSSHLGADDAARVARFLAALDPSRTAVLVDGASTTLTAWLRNTGYLARESMRRSAPQIAANVDAFLEFCRSREPRRGDLGGLLDRIESLEGSAEEPGEGLSPSGQGVQLMTVHAAKGLEFPVVVVAQLGRLWQSRGMEKRPLHIGFRGPDRELRMGVRLGAGFGDPDEVRGWAELLIARDEELEDEYEEKRLFYVAVTRAKERLILCGTTDALDLGRAWKPGYGSWLEDALAGLEADGVALERLLERTTVAAESVKPPPRQRGARAPLATRHAEAIATGTSLAAPTGAEADRDVDADEGAEPEALPGADLQRAAAELVATLLRNEAPATRRAYRVEIPRDISVKHMARSLVCPWRFLLGDYIEHLTPVQDRGESSAGGPAMERGQRVHGFFEAWDLAHSAEDDFERAAAVAELTAEDRALLSQWLAAPKVRAALEAARAFERPAAAKGARRSWNSPGLRRELDLEWRIGLTRVRGRLDAVGVAPDGSLTLIDYKTDTPAARERLEPEYERQTALYAAALERSGLGRVVARRLIYLRQGDVVDFAWSPAEADAVEAAVTERLRSLGEGLAAEVSACDACPLRKSSGRSCPQAARETVAGAGAARRAAAGPGAAPPHG